MRHGSLEKFQPLGQSSHRFLVLVTVDDEVIAARFQPETATNELGARAVCRNSRTTAPG
jgi:hypothetical protein